MILLSESFARCCQLHLNRIINVRSLFCKVLEGLLRFRKYLIDKFDIELNIYSVIYYQTGSEIFTPLDLSINRAGEINNPVPMKEEEIILHSSLNLRPSR